jgi:hypothetical protein
MRSRHWAPYEISRVGGALIAESIEEIIDAHSNVIVANSIVVFKTEDAMNV